MPKTQSIQEFWHDHAGARWLVPMVAVMAIVLLGLAAMLIYPYVSG